MLRDILLILFFIALTVGFGALVAWVNPPRSDDGETEDDGDECPCCGAPYAGDDDSSGPVCRTGTEAAP